MRLWTRRLSKNSTHTRSIKRRCMASFSIKRLYTRPDVVKITIYHKAHTQIDGSFAHGEHDLESISRMSHYAPRMSQALKDHIWAQLSSCRNPTLTKCEDETHTPKVGDLESSGTPECLEFDSRGQNTSDWGVLGVIEKVLKCRCPKWPRIGHLESEAQAMGKRKAGSQTGSLTPDH